MHVRVLCSTYLDNHLTAFFTLDGKMYSMASGVQKNKAQNVLECVNLIVFGVFVARTGRFLLPPL